MKVLIKCFSLSGTTKKLLACCTTLYALHMEIGHSIQFRQPPLPWLISNVQINFLITEFLYDGFEYLRYLTYWKVTPFKRQNKILWKRWFDNVQTYSKLNAHIGVRSTIQIPNIFSTSFFEFSQLFKYFTLNLYHVL